MKTHVFPWRALVLATTLAAALAHSDGGAPSSNGWDVAFVPWGDSDWTTNDFVYYPDWPDWMVSAFRSGGEWQTNPAAWHVPESATNDTGCLQLEVDRALLSTDVLMRTWFQDTTGATLYVDLIDTNETVVVTNLLGASLLSGSGTGTDSVNDVSVPFGTYLDAAGIRLRRGTGEITVYASALILTLSATNTNGQGGSGGSSNNASTATINGSVFYFGTQPGPIRVLAATNAGAWSSPWCVTISGPGSFTLADLPAPATYWVRAYVDANDNGSNDAWEAQGTGLPAPLQLVCGTNVNVTLLEPDSNGDGLSDWGAMLLGLDPSVSNVCARLPFVEMFETNTVHAGDIDGQHGWVAGASNTAFVQTNTVYAGLQALQLDGGASTASVRQIFANSGALTVWTDLRLIARPADAAAATAAAANTVAGFFFDANGRLVVLDGLQPAGQKWVTLTNVAPVTLGSWTRLTVGMDYAAQTWMICLNGTKVAENLGFGIPCSELHCFNIRGGQAFADNVSVSTNIPAGFSTDGDSLPDDWEMQYFGNLDQTDSGDPDHDGLTNLQEYLLGTDPNNADTDGDGIADGDEVQWGLNPAVSNVFAALPWNAGFETSEGYAAGALAGQQGWVVPQGAAIVQADTASSGSQAIRLSPDTNDQPIAGIFFASVTSNVVWAGCDVLTTPGALPANLLPGATAVFGMDQQGRWCGLDGATWIAATNASATSGWTRISIRQDFAARRWDLYVGMDKALANLSFADTNADRFTRFAIWGGASAMNIDSIMIATDAPGDVDTDGDGLPDGWELAHFVNLDQTGSGDFDHDGLSNRQEYLLGSDPTKADSNNDGLNDGDAVQLGLDPLVSNACSRLPFVELFEPDTVHAGDINGQHGWVVNRTNTVFVQTNTVYTGQQALQLDAGASTTSVRQIFANSGASTVWTDLRLIAQPADAVAANAAATNSVAGFFFDANGRLVVLDGLQPAGQKWVTLTNVAPVTLGSWNRLTVGIDYVAQRWLICLNGLKAAENLGFGISCTGLRRFNIQAGQAFADDVSITTNQPAGISLDGDTVSDDWELQYFGNLDQTDSGDPDNDGLTNLQEYLLGTNPNTPDTNGDGISDLDSVLWALNPAASHTFAAVPWSADFEPAEGYAPGPLAGQNGWVVPFGDAVVEQDTVFTNSQAVRLSPSSGSAPVAGIFLLPITNVVVWTDFRLAASPGSLPSVQLPGLTAVFCVGPDGNWAGLDGAIWRSATNRPSAPSAPSGWAHATIRHDFAARRWDLYIGADKIFSNLAFADTNAESFTRFAVVGNASSDTCIDRITVGTNLPGWIDMDGDGLTNDQEAQYGTDPLNPSTAGDGMDDGTAVWLGYDPLVSNRFTRIDAASGTDTWTTGFEPSEGYAAGELDGQNGWTASNGVQVVNYASHSGAQSVLIPGADSAGAPPRTMSMDFGAQGRDIVWLGFYAQVPQGTSGADAFLSSSAFEFSVSSNRVYAYDGALGDWRVSTPLDVSTNWIRFDVGVDKGRQKCLICVNGLLVLDEIGFADPSCVMPGRFTIAGSAGTNLSTRVDDIRISAAGPGTTLQLAGSISGVVTYSGSQTGLIHVVAATTSNGWSSAYGTVLSAPGSYSITGLPLVRNYWINAWVDSNGNGACDPTEAAGFPSAVLLSATNIVVPIALADPDGVPDWWKVLYFGSITNANAAAGADPDHDGLSNLQEYQLGTKPNIADTDGDGISDGDEVNLYHTDPLAAAPLGSNQATVLALDGASVSSTLGGWVPHGTAIASANRRGWVEYQLPVTNAGVFRLEVDGSQGNPYATWNSFKLIAHVDGEYVGKELLNASYGANGTIRFMLPYLPAGAHTLNLYWDNVYDGPQLRVLAVRLVNPGGADANGNGIPDWLDQRFANICSLDTTNATSLVSPTCVEGTGWYPSMMGLAVDGTTTAAAIQPLEDNRWYANVPLDTNASTAVAISFQGGAFVLTNSIVWTPFNLFSGATCPMLRRGDALKLTAYPFGATSGVVTVTVDGQAVQTTIGSPVVCRFATAGVYAVSGTYNGNTFASTSVAVTVVGGGFPADEPVCWWGKTRAWSCPDLPAQTVVQGGPDLVASNTSATSLNLLLNEGDAEHYVAARLEEGGPVLDSRRIAKMWLRASVDGYVSKIGELEDGTSIIEDRLNAGYLPDTTTVWMSVWKSGATFDDGTVVRYLGVSDFDERGEYTYRMYLAPGVSGAPCHSVAVWQGSVQVGAR